MNAATTPANPTPTTQHHTSATTTRADRIHRHLEILDDLIDHGARVARHLADQITASPTTPTPENPNPAPAPGLAADFDRVSRAVRRAILLAQTLEDRRAAPDAAPAFDRTAARKRIIRAVEDDIDSTLDEPDAAPRHAEFLDRLDAPDLDRELATRPIEAIIADIRRDLGLAGTPGHSPWKRRTPADLQTLHAIAAKPATPDTPPHAQPAAPTPPPHWASHDGPFRPKIADG